MAFTQDAPAIIQAAKRGGIDITCRVQMNQTIVGTATNGITWPVPITTSSLNTPLDVNGVLSGGNVYCALNTSKYFDDDGFLFPSQPSGADCENYNQGGGGPNPPL